MAAETKTIRLRLWELVQTGLSEGEALAQVLPILRDDRGRRVNTNRKRDFHRWKAAGLFPPPEAETVDQARPSPPTEKGLTPAVHDARHRNTAKGGEISEADLFKRIKAMLDEITVAERPQTAPGQESTLKTKMVAARFPMDLVSQLESLPGKKSHHLEKALKLYLRALQAG